MRVLASDLHACPWTGAPSLPSLPHVQGSARLDKKMPVPNWSSRTLRNLCGDREQPRAHGRDGHGAFLADLEQPRATNPAVASPKLVSSTTQTSWRTLVSLCLLLNPSQGVPQKKKKIAIPASLWTAGGGRICHPCWKNSRSSQ